MGTKSKSVTVSAQKHVNVYAEVSPNADKTNMAFYGTPGLDLFTSFGDTPVRGEIAVGDFLYAVHRGTFYEVNNAGVRTPRGIIGTTTGRVQMAYNGQQIGLVDGVSMWIYILNRAAVAISTITRVGTLATVTTAVPHGRYTGETINLSNALPAQYNGTFTISVIDANTFTYVMPSDPGASAAPVGTYQVLSSFVQVSSGLFVTPIDITYQAHYFICCFKNSGEYQISALDDGTTWDALDFASAESDPDNLIRVIADHGELVLCGASTIEFWSNSGGLDFPYTNLVGTALEYGLAAPLSMVKYNDSLAGLMKNKMGQVQVMMLQGHNLTKLSSPDIDSLINDYASVSDATAFSYMLGGHPMYEINFPSAAKSWLFDMSSGMWTELQSGLARGRHLAEISVDYLNKPRVTDYLNGNIYTLNQNTYTDNGMPIVRELVSRHLFRDLNILTTSWVQIDMETGVGLNAGQGSNPQLMLQVSRDNGKTWGNELWRDMGKIGQYFRRVIWRRLGRGYDFVFKLRMTDAVKFVIAGAAVTDE